MNTPGKTIRIALAGNPNSGKTTFFNALTGSRARTGNWPGVTVSRREGDASFNGYNFQIVDLPGTYSLTSGSLEEIVARNYLVNGRPDVVVNIIDTSNLERNLVLTSEIIELGLPIVVALNMWDEVKQKGYRVDSKLMSQLLASPCIPTIASKKEGIEEILKKVIEIHESQDVRRKVTVGFGRIIEEEIEKLIKAIESSPKVFLGTNCRWLATKLLENDPEVSSEIESQDEKTTELLETAESSRSRIRNRLGEDPEIAIPDARFGFAAGVFRETTRLPAEYRRNFSDRLDGTIMSRSLGMPIFLVIMWLTFQLTFTGGAPLMDLIDSAVGAFGNLVDSIIPAGYINSLVVDGIIAGVGGVLVFVPSIFILFLIITFLEEWGYMARAAFVMDGLMHKIGLHGKSFVPLLMGFGCNIPAIMATRTLETRRDRLVTMGIAPLMSCGARLPVYTLLIGAFFSEKIAGNLLFLIYVIGVALAVVVALIFRKTLFRGATTPFVMELPPYRMPTFVSVFGTAGNRASHYLKKAGTVILAASVVIWFLSNFPYNPKNDPQWMESELRIQESYNTEIERLDAAYPDITIPKETADLAGEIATVMYGFDDEVKNIDEDAAEWIVATKEMETSLFDLEARYPDLYPASYATYLAELEFDEQMRSLDAEMAGTTLERSFAGYVGRSLEPVLKTAGFDWKISVALFTGLAAKEIVVSTMGTIYSLGETDEKSGALKTALRNDETFNPLVAFSMIIFVLIYSPCIPAIAVQKSESGSWKWALFVMGYLTLLAWICSTLFYQAGKFLGIGI